MKFQLVDPFAEEYFEDPYELKNIYEDNLADDETDKEEQWSLLVNNLRKLHCYATPGVSLTPGNKLREFYNLSPQIQEALRMAAMTVIDASFDTQKKILVRKERLK